MWESLLNQYDINNIKAHIFTQPSLRNKTIYDYNTNMLRTTSECMSAVLGGSNTVCNVSYDSIYHKSNEFGERISRNQLLVLKEELEVNLIKICVYNNFLRKVTNANIETCYSDKNYHLITNISQFW